MQIAAKQNKTRYSRNEEHDRGVMRVPPAVHGPAPKLALSYSAQSVDGRHAASNNQPSWVGEGFEAWPVSGL